ncbi:MAG: DUF255 domain-containing protein [Campylobacterota bacterium]|nr:DUF255 domain-containing protein [Campylobacterota bacterium]
MKIKLFISFFILFFMNNTLSAQQIKWQHELNDAKELAEHFNKPIFLFLESRKCYYCPIIQETTFMDPEVIKTINENFIPLILDNSLGSESDVENSGHAPERLTVSMTPAIYLMGPKEEKLLRKGKKHLIIYGMWSAEDLLLWLDKSYKKFVKLHGAKYGK